MIYVILTVIALLTSEPISTDPLHRKTVTGLERVPVAQQIVFDAPVPAYCASRDGDKTIVGDCK